MAISRRKYDRQKFLKEARRDLLQARICHNKGDMKGVKKNKEKATRTIDLVKLMDYLFDANKLKRNFE